MSYEKSFIFSSTKTLRSVVSYVIQPILIFPPYFPFFFLISLTPTWYFYWTTDPIPRTKGFRHTLISYPYYLLTVSIPTYNLIIRYPLWLTSPILLLSFLFYNNQFLFPSPFSDLFYHHHLYFFRLFNHFIKPSFWLLITHFPSTLPEIPLKVEKSNHFILLLFFCDLYRQTDNITLKSHVYSYFHLNNFLLRM